MVGMPERGSRGWNIRAACGRWSAIHRALEASETRHVHEEAGERRPRAEPDSCARPRPPLVWTARPRWWKTFRCWAALPSTYSDPRDPAGKAASVRNYARSVRKLPTLRSARASWQCWSAWSWTLNTTLRRKALLYSTATQGGVKTPPPSLCLSK